MEWYVNRLYNYQLQYVAMTDMANGYVSRMQLIKQEEIGKFSDKKYRLLAIQISAGTTITSYQDTFIKTVIKLLQNAISLSVHLRMFGKD